MYYATIANITDFDRCIDMPLEKRMSVKVLNLSYTTQETLEDFDSYEQLKHKQHCEVPILMVNNAATYSPVLHNSVTTSPVYDEIHVNNSATTSTVYDRGKEMNMEKIMDSELYILNNNSVSPEISLHSNIVLNTPTPMYLRIRFKVRYMVYDRGKFSLSPSSYWHIVIFFLK